MIDYDATLQKFFAEVIKYLEKVQRKVEDEAQLNLNKKMIDVVRRIAAEPAKYADYSVRVAANMEGDVKMGFFPTMRLMDNRALLAYDELLHALADFDSQFAWKRQEAQQKLLAALKTVKYINSTNILKDFTFAFKSPKSFAIKKEQKQM